MQVGILRHRIKFKNWGMSENELGEQVPAYVVFKEVWASVDIDKGFERIEGGKVVSRQTVKIVTRYHEGITPDMIIEFNGREFEIQPPIKNPQERNKELNFFCIERV